MPAPRVQQAMCHCSSVRECLPHKAAGACLVPTMQRLMQLQLLRRMCFRQQLEAELAIPRLNVQGSSPSQCGLQPRACSEAAAALQKAEQRVHSAAEEYDKALEAAGVHTSTKIPLCLPPS